MTFEEVWTYERVGRAALGPSQRGVRAGGTDLLGSFPVQRAGTRMRQHELRTLPSRLIVERTEEPG